MYDNYTAIEQFDLSRQEWTTLGQLETSRSYFSADVLGDGSVLVAGGRHYEQGRTVYDTAVNLLTFAPPPPSTPAPLAYNTSNTNSAQQNTVDRTFTLNAGETVEVGTCSVSGSSASGDTYLRLFGAGTQVEVAANDDSCGSTASFIQYTASATGTFELRAGCYSSGGCSGTVAFRIVPSPTSPLAYSVTNTNSAQQATLNRTFTLKAGDTLEVGTCNVPGSSASGDTYLRLFGAGTQVAFNDDSCGGTASFIQYTATSTGAYELRAGCYAGVSCSGTVTFRITPAKP